ncbi:MAG: hypothetical protein ACPGJS_15385, partial [Flammeovirgaceae bacterium]
MSFKSVPNLRLTNRTLSKHIKIGTRKSKLALWQAEHVAHT